MDFMQFERMIDLTIPIVKDLIRDQGEGAWIADDDQCHRHHLEHLLVVSDHPCFRASGLLNLLKICSLSLAILI